MHIHGNEIVSKKYPMVSVTEESISDGVLQTLVQYYIITINGIVLLTGALPLI